MQTDPEFSRLARYLAGECTPEEAAEIRRWLEADPAHGKLLATAQQVWKVTGPEPVGWNVNAAWSRVAGRVAGETDERNARPRAAALGRWLAGPAVRFWVRAAAVVLIVGSGTLLVDHLARDWSPRAVETPMRQVATAKGQRAMLQLSDGTQITLGTDTRLRFPPVFNAKRREVYLEGEAFFKVAHDASKPFVVYAGSSVTQVLGTEFVLKAYPGSDAVQVVVAQGRVRLRSAQTPDSAGVVLTRKQLGRLTPDGQTSVRDGVEVDRYVAWTNGRLSFDNASLRDVLAELEHWYDVRLVLADSTLGERRLTASYDQQPLPDILQALALTLDIRYERVGGAVLFRR